MSDVCWHVTSRQPFSSYLLYLLFLHTGKNQVWKSVEWRDTAVSCCVSTRMMTEAESVIIRVRRHRLLPTFQKENQIQTNKWLHEGGICLAGTRSDCQGRWFGNIRAERIFTAVSVSALNFSSVSYQRVRSQQWKWQLNYKGLHAFSELFVLLYSRKDIPSSLTTFCNVFRKLVGRRRWKVLDLD